MDNDKAYISENLYLPKSKIRINGIINSLTFKDRKNEILNIWGQTESHLIVPRHYIKEEKYSLYPFPFIDLNPKIFPKIDFQSNIEWRDKNQELAFNSMMNNKNGILNLNTGKGKTVIALQRIVENKTPALIVVHNSFLKDQWKERISQLIKFKGKIGSLEGKKADWRQPITIAMILSLANRIKTNTLPEGFKEWFGISIYDEVHHLSAPVFSKAADICLGHRYGLSATPRRADGLDCITTYHLGNIFYEDMSYDLLPKIYFIETNVIEEQKEWENIWTMINKISTNEYSIGLRFNLLNTLYKSGRKIIALSSRLNLMDSLAKRFPEEDVCIINESTPSNERTRLIKTKKVILAIGRLGLEGLDDPDIDTLVFLTPIGGDNSITENGKEYLGNQIRQGFGRILRSNGKDKKPEVYFFDDVKIESLSLLITQAQIFLKRNGFDYKIRKI